MASVFVFATTATLAAEKIQFSKPAVEIAAPAKVEENLPETRSKRLDFAAPDVTSPIVQQPAIIRLQPRDKSEEDDRLSSRDPRRGNDSSRETSDSGKARNPFGPRDRLMGLPDSERALSPVTDFDWDARESSRAKESASGNRSADGNDARARNPLATRDEYGLQNDALHSPFDLFTARPKEKLSRELRERRAAFEELLNPGAAIAARNAGSLEPVNAVEVLKPAPLPVMPAMGGAKLDSRPMDPNQAFNLQQARLRGPMLEDVNKKYSAPAASPAPSTHSRLQSPLNRQPTTREFPARKF